MLKLLLTPVVFIILNIKSLVVVPKVDPRRSYALFMGGNLAKESLYQKDETQLFTEFKNNLEQQFQYGSVDIIVSGRGCLYYTLIRMNIDKKGAGYQLKLYTYHQKDRDKLIEEYYKGGSLAFETKIDQTKLNELKSLLTVDSTYSLTYSNNITLKQGNKHLNINGYNPEAPIYGFIVKLAKDNNFYRLF